MATDFIYPTNERLDQVAQEKLPNLMADRPIFSILPIRTQDEFEYSWEQLDRFTGLQAVRGLNGAPTHVKAVGINRFRMQPGVYGEYMTMDEMELTTRRKIGTFGTPIDLEDLVLQKQDQLLNRRLDRIELIGWTLLCTNTFSVSSETGAVLHTDSFNFRTFTSTIAWSTLATSTPLADFRAVKLLHRGYSVTFGGEATAYMNGTTYNYMVGNNNAADLYGRRTAGLGTIQSLPQINTLLQGDDLPQVKVYDGSYLDSLFNPILFIPDNIVVVVGKRPAGQVVGGYVMTRNVNTPSLAPGAYMKVVDTVEREVPRRIEVHDGHNGGPAIEYPSTVVIMTVG